MCMKGKHADSWVAYDTVTTFTEPCNEILTAPIFIIHFPLLSINKVTS